MSEAILVSGNAGQGKTTLAKNIAFSLSSFGYDVLLVDGDVKTPKLGYHVGKPTVNRTIQKVLRGEISLSDALYRESSGLKLLLSGLADSPVAHPSTILTEIKRMADIVVIDVPTYDTEWYKTKCPVVLVSQPDLPSAMEVKKLSTHCKVKGLVINRVFGDGVELSPGNIQELTSLSLVGIVPEEPRMREALRHGYSVVEFDPDLRTSIILKQIAAKLMNVEYSAGRNGKA